MRSSSHVLITVTHFRSLSPSILTNSPEVTRQAGNADASQFDGYRFARIRDLPGNAAKYQAPSADPYQLNFSAGKHACPGRFFAIFKLKVMIITLLRDYDFRLPGDIAGLGGVDKFPKSNINGVNNMPSTSAQIEFKRRETPAA